MKLITIYISKYYIDFFNILQKDYNLNKTIFYNKTVNINFITNFNIKLFNTYDIMIKMKKNYSNDDINIMKSNIIFINSFKKRDLIGYKNILLDNINLYPYTFYLEKFNINTIKHNINIYNDYYNNNKINKDFGIDYWIVKDNFGQQGKNTNIYTTDELLKLNKNNVVIQKYLEKTLMNILKQKIDYRIHLLIIPVIKYNKKTKKYEIKYDKNNNIKLHYYLHNIIFERYSSMIYNIKSKDMKVHLTNAYIQENPNNFILNDNILYNKIKNKISLFIHQSYIKNIINNCIDNYQYFYQIIAFDLICTEYNNDLFLIDVNTNSVLISDNIYKSKLLNLCFQRILRCIYKLKYNIKYKIYKFTNNYFEKI